MSLLLLVLGAISCVLVHTKTAMQAALSINDQGHLVAQPPHNGRFLIGDIDVLAVINVCGKFNSDLLYSPLTDSQGVVHFVREQGGLAFQQA
jgi:hypothetical protein